MLNVLSDSLPTTQIAPIFFPELHVRSLLAEVPSALRIMPDPFVAHLQARGMDNLPQNNTGDASSGAGSSAILGRKALFWSHCFQTIPLANSTEIKHVSQFSLSHLKWKKDQLSS